MALKDRLNDALQATPSENTARLETLRAVLAASGGGSDAEVQAALSRLISEREQKAASYSAAGQTDQARAERAEIDALRGFLRAAAPDTKSAPAPARKKAKAATQVEQPVEIGPVVSRNQLIIGAATLIAIVAVALFFLRPWSNAGQTTAAGSTQMALYADDRTLGNPKAPITMIEYAAPTCPHCAHFDMTVMPRVKQEYIDTGKVFYVFRTFPLSATDGAIEGIARLCLPADKYFQFLDLMFRNQPKWDPDGYQIPDVGAAVKQMAGIMGVTPEQADRCMTDTKEQQRINQVGQDAVNRYNINGTPTFVINGTVVQTTEGTWPQLKARFDSLLSNKK
jgi:protein-disulfide isomerase